MSTKTKLIGMFVTGIAMGCVLGARLEYMTVSAKRIRQVLKQYQNVKDTFDMTDAELVANAKKVPQFFEDEKRQDEMAAVFGLGAFRALQEGDSDGVKAELLRPIGMYYRLYHDKGDDTMGIIARIEEAAQKYPDLAAELSRKIGDDQKDAPQKPD
jgi:hypothetical protein